MTIHELIDHLAFAKTGAKYLDRRIAELIGWTVREEVKDDGTRQHVWSNPSGEDARVPRFTTNLQAAYELSMQLAPGQAIAVSWGPSSGSAVIDDQSNRVDATTPELALCIAALRHYAKNQRI
ncbi:hypothetical protein SAMN02982989_3435 [Xaviernesmea oryzae]|uniref:Phage ABA sandwich domain-containing protein n=1 Tax=Xaviernesmea oryzae TaxID=464029 RepID=A0A1X7G984_9HYPH|nr:hypothetical protein [Xaviernesmea oryzae]SMF66036.1 hypothetical protein SAMN02982989_3435 [Xaviernesmea oryzae]